MKTVTYFKGSELKDYVFPFTCVQSENRLYKYTNEDSIVDLATGKVWTDEEFYNWDFVERHDISLSQHK